MGRTIYTDAVYTPAFKVNRTDSWIHQSRVKVYTLGETEERKEEEENLATQDQGDQYSCEPLED